ncbi:MAG: putative redox protein [Acidimicrobiales bacterium]|jgi:putative redox protein
MASITAELLSDFRVDITNGTHPWRADEPASLGGDNTGPNPYDLLLGAVASCTVITLSMYTKRKGIEMTSLSVEYSYDKIHANDCEAREDDAAGMVDHITSRIFIDGDFDEETRNRLIGIAQRCPVHKTLEAGIHFEETIFAG